jgi:DNA polymerase-3 subunit gamma/tau
MLKLVHAQRLLPIEQLLSNVAGGVPVRSAAPQSSGWRVSPRPAPAPAASPSPFSSGGTAWETGPSLKQSASAVSLAEMDHPPVERPEAASSSPSVATAPFSPQSTQLRESPADPDPVPKPADVAEISAAPNMETLRLAVISVLADGGHATAAQLLGAGAWSLDGSSLRIEVSGIGKKMLSLTVNSAAEKIIRQELQRLAAPSRFLIVPGEGSAAGAAPAAVVPAGSIQETALANPLVQRAKEIFKAEVRSVIDLRTR